MLHDLFGDLVIIPVGVGILALLHKGGTYVYCNNDYLIINNVLIY